MKQILSAFTLLLSGFVYAAPPGVGPVDALVVNDETVPVPVENINEPGREPYNVYIEYLSSHCQINCSDFYGGPGVLLFNGPEVPLGKRLVVQWVSGTVPADTQFNIISFQQQRVIANQLAKWQYFGPFYDTSSFGFLWGMSSGAFFTVEPGEPLRIRVEARSLNDSIASISVGGYLIDVP